MQRLVHGRLAARAGNAVAIDLESGWQCRLYVLADDLVRVLLVRDATLREPRTWSIAPAGTDVPWEGRDRLDLAGFPCPAFDVVERAGGVAIVTNALQVGVRLAPFGLDWSAGGKPFAADRPTCSYEWSERTGAVRHSMARTSSDRFFGLGDKTGPLDHHGRRLRTLALDALGYDACISDPLYKHWPFVIGRDEASGVAYGQLYDTQAPATFDLGCEFDNYHGFYRSAEIDDGDLDYYVFVGPDLPGVVRKFTELTGRMALPPRWSLGYANTAMSLADAPDAQARVTGFVDEAARHDVPLSAFHFGSGYSSIGAKRYVFTWNRSKFPDPRAAIAHFRDRGVRVVVNLKPCLLDDHPRYAEVAARDGFVADGRTGGPCISQFWDGEGAHVDFTHPAAIRWWQDSLREQVLDVGIDAGWNDNNEYEIWDDAGRSHGFGTPLPIRRSRPLQALLMTRATAEAQAAHRPGERSFTVTRAGPPGIQRYAQTWSGDNTTSWKTLRWNLRMGLTMSLSGMFNTGHDIGGFAGPVPDAELLVRWTQNGIFSPRCIMNSWKTGGEVNSPWLHADALAPIRAAIRLRYRLMPYLYTLMQRAAAHGEPVLRPLFYEFPDDARSWLDADDFLFGPQVLVANVLEPGMTRREVWLPPGPDGWYELQSGARHPSGTCVTVAAPLDHIPVFVRAGSLLPLTAANTYARLHDEPSRLLRLFPPQGASQSSFALYEDDGLTHGHATGDFTFVELAMTTSTQEIHLARTSAPPSPTPSTPSSPPSRTPASSPTSKTCSGASSTSSIAPPAGSSASSTTTSRDSNAASASRTGPRSSRSSWSGSWPKG